MWRRRAFFFFFFFFFQEKGQGFVIGGPPPRTCRRSSSYTNEVLVIDGDNVRGKAEWAYSSAELANMASREEACLLFLDHAEVREALRLGPTAALAFAGRKCTADDAIVDAVEWFLQNSNKSLAIVTSDFGLRTRLSYLNTREKRRIGANRVRFLPSSGYVDSLREKNNNDIDEENYVKIFAAAHQELAEHVVTCLQVPRRWDRENRRRVLSQSSNEERKPLIHSEQTWMRVVLAERLRLALNQEKFFPHEDHFFTAFAEAYADEDKNLDDESKLLLHPLADKKQRHDLFRFAEAIRKKTTSHLEDVDDTEEEELVSSSSEEETTSATRATPTTTAAVAFLRPKTRRVRRKRARRKRELSLLSPPTAILTGNKGALANLMKDRDGLEAALFDWLRTEPAALKAAAAPL